MGKLDPQMNIKQVWQLWYEWDNGLHGIQVAENNIFFSATQISCRPDEILHYTVYYYCYGIVQHTTLYNFVPKGWYLDLAYLGYTDFNSIQFNFIYIAP